MKMTNLSLTSVTLTAAMLLIAGMPRHGAAQTTPLNQSRRPLVTIRRRSK